MARAMLKSVVGGNQISEYENSDEKRARGNKKSLKILMNNIYSNNVQTFCIYEFRLILVRVIRYPGPNARHSLYFDYYG